VLIKVLGKATQSMPKRSTVKGEGRTKLIATLTKDHHYADGGCLKQDPIGNNELARLAKVSARQRPPAIAWLQVCGTFDYSRFY